MNISLPDTQEYTPEQRRLLARAYRLILNWPRDEARLAEARKAREFTSSACAKQPATMNPLKGDSGNA